MKIKFTNNKTEYETNIDQAWVWVRLEKDLGLTLSEAQDKMSDSSTWVITYAMWIASEVQTPYDDWIKKLEHNWEVIHADPKDIQ